MQLKRLSVPSLILALSLGLLGGCAGKSEPETSGNVMAAEYKGAPDWVVKGCSAYWGDENRGERLCGVGSMGGTDNVSLARSTAVGRGRTEIARTLQTKVVAMLKDYQATVTGGDAFGEAAGDEAYIEDVARQITETTLTGTEMVDSWISNSGTFYALVVMDLERFQDSVRKMENLSEAVRAAVQQRAANAFHELDTLTGADDN